MKTRGLCIFLASRGDGFPTSNDPSAFQKFVRTTLFTLDRQRCLMTTDREDRSGDALEKLPFVFGGDFHSTARYACARKKVYLGHRWLKLRRLNFQHFIQRRQYGFLLHPTIPIDSGNLRVADIGAGTWYQPCDK